MKIKGILVFDILLNNLSLYYSKAMIKRNPFLCHRIVNNHHILYGSVSLLLNLSYFTTASIFIDVFPTERTNHRHTGTSSKFLCFNHVIVSGIKFSLALLSISREREYVYNDLNNDLP